MAEKPIIAGRNEPSTKLTCSSAQGFQSDRKFIAAWAGILGLVLLAAVGVVFIVNQRHAMPSAALPAAPDATSVDIGPKQPSPTNVAKNKAIFPLSPAIPEPLAIIPRVIETSPVIPEVRPAPVAVNPQKIRPDPTTEGPSTAAPPTLDLGTDKSKTAASGLSPTAPAPRVGRLESFGTKIRFLTEPAPAFEQAGKDKKLVLMIDYSGSFADGSFTSEKAEEYRQECLLADDVADFLKTDFVCVCQSISGQRVKSGGNVATYFCLSDGRVLHAIPGPVNAETFLNEARWVLKTKAAAEMKISLFHFVMTFKIAHREQCPTYIDPKNLTDQAKVHRLLSRWNEGLPPDVSELRKKIYEQIFSE